MRWAVELEGEVAVVARSAVRLGFDRPEQREFLGELQAACRRLVARPGANLRAVYAHPLTLDPVDLENVLLYNLGLSCVGHLAHDGVVLEREPDLRLDHRFSGDLAHEVRYEIATAGQWSFWKPSRRLYDVVLDDQASLINPTAKKVWVAGRRAGMTVQGVRPAGPLLVDVEVGGSAGLLGLTKPLVDGLLAVGHSYLGGDQEALEARREAIHEDLEPAELATWLGLWDAPLGPWRFLLPRGEGVQVSPADDRIVGLRMTRQAEPGVHFSVHAAEPV